MKKGNIVFEGNVINRIENNKWIFGAINLTVFVIHFLFCCIEPLYSDDLDVSANGTNGILQNSLLYAINYHMTWGGRSVAAFLRMFMMHFSKMVYNIINSVLYVVFANIIYGTISKKIHNGLLVLIYSLLWFFIPTFGEGVIWFTGSVAYLWPGIPFVFVNSYFCKRLENREERHCYCGLGKKIILSVIMFVVGFVAGDALEPAACALVVGVFMWLIYMRRKGQKKYIYDYACIIGILLGFLFLFTSKGEWARGSVVVESASIFVRFGYRAVRSIYYGARYLLVHTGIMIAITLLGDKCKDMSSFIKENIQQVWLLTMVLLNLGAMIFSSGYSTRVLLYPLAMVLIALAISYKKFVKTVSPAMFIIISTVGIFALLHALTGIIVCARNDVPLLMDIVYHDENIGNIF